MDITLNNQTYPVESRIAFWKGFRNQRSALVAFSIIVLLILSSFLSSITKYDPVAHGNLIETRYLSPSWDHPFGTDKFGRDVLSRALYGGRISLTIAISVVVLSILIGVSYGAIAGYFGKILDSILMRILDFFLAFPLIFLIITIVAIFRPSTWYLVLLLSLTSWMETARLVRAEVLSIKTREYILAAKGLGFSYARILFRHVIPNSLTPVLVSAPMKVGEIILLESALSFLGLGVQPPTPSWGNIIHDGFSCLSNAWWISAFPGILIVLTVMSFNVVADALREIINPGKIR